MSKLESLIRRMTAQRDCLNYTAKLVKNIPGIVFELGLGNGRTYDHLCQILPDREIYVFERNINSFPSCRPPEDHMFIGDVFHTLPKALGLFGKKVAMLHNDLGTSDSIKTREMINEIPPLLEPFMLPGSIIVSSFEFHFSSCKKISGPNSVKQGRYFLYRAF